MECEMHSLRALAQSNPRIHLPGMWGHPKTRVFVVLMRDLTSLGDVETRH